MTYLFSSKLIKNPIQLLEKSYLNLAHECLVISLINYVAFPALKREGIVCQIRKLIGKTQHYVEKPKEAELGVSSESLLKSLFRLGMHKEQRTLLGLISVEVAKSAGAVF